MVALIELTREELILVLAGYADEPGYRPFPSARRIQAERDEEEQAWDEDREPRELAPTKATSLERLLLARHWQEHTIELALLMSGRKIVALARAGGGRRVPAGGFRRVMVGPWHPLQPPIQWNDIVRRLPPRHRTKASEIRDGEARPFSPGLAREVSQVLAEMIPDYRELRADLTQPLTRPRRRSVEQLEQRDANATALSILTPQWRSLAPLTTTRPPPLVRALDDALAGASEDDLITDDSAVFEGWARGGRPVRGWWGFESNGRRMWIKNINVSTAEARTGADLVYVRTRPRAVVLVQYKKLLRDQHGEPYMPHDGRLHGQLHRLLSFVSDPDAPAELRDHRLGPEFAFVKFVDDQDQDGLEESELTRGRYMPAGFVDALLQTPAIGPRPGKSRYVARERSLDSRTFVSLVRDGWLGSRGRVTEVLEEVLASPSRSLTIAVDRPATPEP